MATQPRLLSVEEYLSGEQQSPVRHEYWNGQVVAMAGGSPTHADIIANLNALIKAQIRNTGCYVRSSDLRVRTAPDGLYAYPDLVISCQSQYDGSTLLNPYALIEVLSESTADYDRGRKFERYRKIDSLREYVCVSQDLIKAEHHVKTGNQWVMSEYQSPRDRFVLSLPCGNVSLVLSDIYDDLEWGQLIVL